MIENEKQQDGLDEVNEALTRTEQFIEKYQKKIIIAVLIVIVVVSGILALRQYYFLPKEVKAQADLFRGEFYFQNGEFQTAIDGNGGDYNGFETIIKENGGPISQIVHTGKETSKFIFTHKVWKISILAATWNELVVQVSSQNRTKYKSGGAVIDVDCPRSSTRIQEV